MVGALDQKSLGGMIVMPIGKPCRIKGIVALMSYF
jgi:hypothetical protein